MKRKIEDRFWEKVDKNGPVPPHQPELGQCWSWIAYIGNHGYGLMYSEPGKPETSNRIAWKIQNGAIPDGLWVLHKCDNRSCVRVDHLFIGTPKQNSLDCKAKGRNPQLLTRSHCPQGHAMSGANLRIYKTSRFCRACQKEKSVKFYAKYGHSKGEYNGFRI